jgi:5-hydroxyisourate hydrolase-like protein (transthyretin family)
MKRVALATVIFSAVALTARAQPTRVNASSPPTPIATISGRVVSEESGDPIPNARVSLVNGNQAASAVLTDRDGRFKFAGRSGRVTIGAKKTGYARREVIADATQPINVRLPRAAAISGRVVDAFNDPIQAAHVVAEVAKTPTGFTVVATADTDDRGEYRLGSIDPGTVNIAVMTQGKPITSPIGPNETVRFPSILKTYYPGAREAGDAQAFHLAAGDERESIDFVVPEGQVGNDYIVIGPLVGGLRAVPQNPGVIRGRVVSTDGRSVSRAAVWTSVSVSLQAPDPGVASRLIFQPITVTADGDGRFEFQDLPKGKYRIAAGKTGYSNPDGQSVTQPFLAPGVGVELDLAEGEIRERIDLTLAPWGTLEGHVFDELGEPVQGVTVQLLQVRFQAGRRRLAPNGGSMRVTNDRGRFRLYGVPPGRYIVSATAGDVASADLPGYTRSYFPGTLNAGDAQYVSMGVSQQVSGLDFSLSRAPTALVAGTLLDSAGAPTTGGSLRLMPSLRSDAITATSFGARILPDGRFEFPNVPPGQYIVRADHGRRNSSTEGEFGTLPVSVNGDDVTGLVLQTSAGSTIAGRVTFDSYLGAKAPGRGQIEISPVPVDPDQAPMSPAAADILDDWRFSMSGVNGSRRLQLQRAPPEWMLKAIRARGIDVTDRPLTFGRGDQSLTDVEVVLTDQVTDLRVTIVDDHARPAAKTRLVVFPIDRDRWYAASRFLRNRIAGDDGTVTMAGLPPGSYYAVALAQMPTDGPEALQDPAYLESLVPRATAFALGDGQKQILNLKIIDR